MVAFLNICRKRRISVISSSQWNMSLVSTFWVIWRKVIHTCEAPDFWRLHKNMSCMFPLMWKTLGNVFLRYRRVSFSYFPNTALNHRGCPPIPQNFCESYYSIQFKSDATSKMEFLWQKTSWKMLLHRTSS